MSSQFSREGGINPAIKAIMLVENLEVWKRACFKSQTAPGSAMCVVM